MKYNKTKHQNIFWYETAKGKFYYVRRSYYLNGVKKEVTKSKLRTMTEARSALAEIELKIDNNDFAYNKNLTVSQYWEIYCDNRLRTGTWAPNTEYNKLSIYNNNIKDRFANVKMRDIYRIDYENHINSLLESKTRNSVVQIHGVLNAMLNHAVTNKMLDDNPINGIHIGKSKIKKSNKRLSLSDFKIWDNCAKEVLDNYSYSMILITYFGARQSEVAGIKLGCIDRLNSGKVRIILNDSRTRLRSSGGDMKTLGSERYMVLDLESSKYILDAVEHSKKAAMKYNRILGPDDYLFIIDYKGANRSNLGKPIRPDRIGNLFDVVSGKCGIHVSPHMMRHFFATQGQIAGVPVEHMAAALGHTTSYMTAKYTHIKDEVTESVSDSFINAIKLG